MKTLEGKRIALLVNDGTARDSLMLSREALILAGADTILVSPRSGEIPLATSQPTEDRIQADAGLEDAESYDALLVPDGALASEKAQEDETTLTFIGSFPRSGRPVAAIGRGILPVMRCGEFAGCRVSAGEDATDLRGAGVRAQARALVGDGLLLSARSSDGLTDFNNAMIEHFARVLAAAPGMADSR